MLRARCAAAAGGRTVGSVLFHDEARDAPAAKFSPQIGKCFFQLPAQVASLIDGVNRYRRDKEADDDGNGDDNGQKQADYKQEPGGKSGNTAEKTVRLGVGDDGDEEKDDQKNGPRLDEWVF